MAFYVAVGPRLFLFRAGMLLTGVMGSLTYWWACRRRPAVLPPCSSPEAPAAVPGHSDLPPTDRGPTFSLSVLENADERCGALR